MILTEFEATFPNIDKEDIRKRLQYIGAHIVHGEQLLKRIAFHLPMPDVNAWARVRDEFGKVTMTYKNIAPGTIEGQKEIEIVISSFDSGVELLERIGCTQKSYQETYRETWETAGGVQVVIDTWPFLEPFVEIEGENEVTVKEASSQLGFDWSNAIFDAVTVQYVNKYNVSRDRINNDTPIIIFDMENPFL